MIYDYIEFLIPLYLIRLLTNTYLIRGLKCHLFNFQIVLNSSQSY